MAYACRDCGSYVEINARDNTAYCSYCDKELSPKETISSWKLDARMDQLRAMHTLMQNANDEGIYMSWIYTMPDGATTEDFRDIALDDDMYNECFDVFVRLIKKEGMRW